MTLVESGGEVEGKRSWKQRVETDHSETTGERRDGLLKSDSGQHCGTEKRTVKVTANRSRWTDRDGPGAELTPGNGTDTYCGVGKTIDLYKH